MSVRKGVRSSVLLVPALTAVFLVVVSRVIDLPSEVQSEAEKGWQDEVEHVIDGDTLIVDNKGVEEHVRLLGVDAPEVAGDGQPGDACADEATALTGRLAATAVVEVVSDPSQPDEDRYGRTLDYV